MSEFAEKAELINKLLERLGLDFTEGLTEMQQEELDLERQALVIRSGWNRMSVAELRKLLDGDE